MKVKDSFGCNRVKDPKGMEKGEKQGHNNEH